MSGHDVEMLDDLSTGHRESVPDNVVFHQMSLRDAARVLTPEAGFDGVLHVVRRGHRAPPWRHEPALLHCGGRRRGTARSGKSPRRHCAGGRRGQAEAAARALRGSANPSTPRWSSASTAGRRCTRASSRRIARTRRCCSVTAPPPRRWADRESPGRAGKTRPGEPVRGAGTQRRSGYLTVWCFPGVLARIVGEYPLDAPEETSSFTRPQFSNRVRQHRWRRRPPGPRGG